jgi:hypothetical protein
LEYPKSFFIFGVEFCLHNDGDFSYYLTKDKKSIWKQDHFLIEEVKSASSFILACMSFDPTCERVDSDLGYD